MTEIRLELKDPRAVAALLREMLPINADDFNPEERPTIESICSQIEEQVRSLAEPQEFGSLIRANGLNGSLQPRLWQLSPKAGKHYWESEDGAVEVWSELTDVEVLRVGLGSSEEEFRESYVEGGRHLASKIHARLTALLADAITSERKNAYEKAIQAVEELAP